MIVGATITFVLATTGLLFGVEPIPTWYYHLAWWSYIAALDDVNHRLAGRSLLRGRPAHFAWLALVSVLWWTLFELVNLRLGNWYYVMSPEASAVRWSSGILAFATVLPGVLETLELLENLGRPRAVRARALVWTPVKEASTFALGIASVVLPLAWPDLFYPLAWGAAVFLLEPWNRRHARRSFLRDLEQGDATAFVRTLLAGLVCGGVWESLNALARMKWIYTVPVFEEWKLFEMPLLGFLGFPPFAVECLVFLRFLGGLSDRMSAPTRHTAQRAFAVLGPPLAIAFFAFTDRVTVDSFFRPVSEMRSLPPEVRAALARAGLRTPERAARALADPGERARWAVRTGLPEPALSAAADSLALAALRGLGDDRALQLRQLGVRRVSDLARWRAPELAGALRAQAHRPEDRFLERRAGIWIRAAHPR
jgi:hypothetical protein